MTERSEMKRLMALFESTTDVAVVTKRQQKSSKYPKAPIVENIEDQFADDMRELHALIASIDDEALRDRLSDQNDLIGSEVAADDDEGFYESYGDLKKVLRAAHAAVEAQPTKYLNIEEWNEGEPLDHVDGCAPGVPVVFSRYEDAGDTWFVGVVTADGQSIEGIQQRSQFG